MNAVERLVQQVLKVPPQPDPPVGGAGTLEVFRAAEGFFHYRIVTWFLRQVSVFTGIIVGFFMFSELEGMAARVMVGLEFLALATAILLIPVSFIMVSLDFKNRWYMVTDRSLRIREGVMGVQEKTMTFSNIQNVAIRQGPLQRFFGIADVEVRTAGGGGGDGDNKDPLSDNMHVGYFHGVDNAEVIRDLIMNHLRRLAAGGLGDPEDASLAPKSEASMALASAPSGLVGEEAVVAAAQGLLGEVRGLRSELGSSVQ